MAYKEQLMKKTLWKAFLENPKKHLLDIFGGILFLLIILNIFLGVYFPFVEGIKEFGGIFFPILLLVASICILFFLESENEGSVVIIFSLVFFIVSCCFLFFSSSERPFKHEGMIHDPRVNKEIAYLDSIWTPNGIRYYKNDFAKEKVFPKTKESKSIVFSASLEYDFTKSGIPLEKMKDIEVAMSAFFESKDTLDMKTAFVEHMKGIIVGFSVERWIEKFDTKPYRRNFRDALNKKATEIGVFVRKVNVYLDIKEDD